MSKPKEYIITFDTSTQITQDQWKKISPTKRVAEGFTVREMIEWYRKIAPQGPLEIKLIELD